MVPTDCSHEAGIVEAVDADRVDCTNIANISDISGETYTYVDGAVDVRY